MVASASVVRPVLGRAATRGVRMFAAGTGGSDDLAARDVLFGDAGKPPKGGAGKKILIGIVFIAAFVGGFFGVQTFFGKKGVDTGNAPQLADAGAPSTAGEAAAAPEEGAPPAPAEGAASEKATPPLLGGGAAPAQATPPALAKGTTPTEGAPPAPSGAPGTAEAPSAPPNPLEKLQADPRMKQFQSDMMGALKQAGVTDEVIAKLGQDPAVAADPSGAGLRALQAAGVDLQTVMAAITPVIQRHQDLLADILRAFSGGAAMAGMGAAGPAPTSAALERMQRRYPGSTFTEQNGNYVSDTGKLFVVSGGYVFPIERDFTVGRAF